MKKIYIILVAYILLPYINYAQTKSTLATDQIKGKVKTLTQKVYVGVLKGSNIEKGSMLNTEIYIYNEKGNVTEMNYCNADSSVKTKSTYKYNVQGKVIEYIEYMQYNHEGEIKNKTISTYDAKGNKTEDIISNAKGTSSYINTYIYDAKGNMIEDIETNKDNKVDHTTKYKYDAKGNQVEKARYNEAGIITWKYTYQYDDKGNMIEKAGYGADGKLNIRTTYKYDDNNNQIEMVNFNATGAVEVKENDRYEDVDTTGNWLKKTVFENDKPTKITDRVFVYYK